ncbi:hypothetical protein BDV38DRAFT_280578 [Aspergillus pseudotamarii]|uniref:Tyrosinase copper-binding domain-containing protein n=1 Tax=Aspergillus pseudotamarii TaxID=132259 RepID=A0A5N6T1N2_ASPPS|nr:uncharacterized protein BDV38DRAFT_280578 [Aspergillus pseudotamarii]KAE8140114.1 hypothetical protein BDV38DRAFT_280578 [Aspergillus pseudotamarii]
MKGLLLVLSATAGIALATSAACTSENALVRKEWRELEDAERKDYIEAVLCLRDRPSILSNEDYPGVQDRWDDFVATHINYTNTIHFNGLLLPWHRQFVYLWEKTLREECGYNGSVPYWNWALDTDNLLESPVFDGSATSLSGNGAFDPDEPGPCTPGGICFPRGTGGGCVESGPFKDFEVHLGPFPSALVKSYGAIPADAWDYNPRCLHRNLHTPMLAALNNQTVIDRMQATTNIVDWLAVMSPSDPRVSNPHSGGHGSVGGAMHDFFASPQDPSFMLHHAFIDRLWAQWQEQDEENRRYAINGTTIIYDPPDAPLVTLDTLVEFGTLSPPRKVEKMMDPSKNGYCYTYT